MGGVDTSHISNIGPGKWCGGCAVNGTHIYGMPFNADQILVYSLKKHRTLGINVMNVGYDGGDMSYSRPKEGKWAGALHYDGIVYGIPYNANHILAYDRKTGGLRGIPTQNVGLAKWHGGAVYRGIIYGAPWGADNMLCYNCDTDTLYGIDVSALTMQGAKWRGIVATRGRVCCIPNNANCIAVYDVESDDLFGVQTKGISERKGFQKWDGGVAVDGKVYGVPSNSDEMFCLDVETKTVVGIPMYVPMLPPCLPSPPPFLRC